MDELKHHNVLATAAYLDAVKYQPSPRRTQIETSRVERNFYRQIFSVYRNPIEQTAAMAPFLQIGRIDVSAAIEAEFQRLVQYGLYPCYLAVHGSLGARRFVAIEGQPKYLTVYDFEDVRVSESDAWTRARASNPWTRGVQPNCGMTRSRQGSISVSIRIAQDFLIWCLPLLACRPSCDDREGAPQRLLTRSTA